MWPDWERWSDSLAASQKPYWGISQNYTDVYVCVTPYTYVVRSIDEHEYSDLVSIRFLVESVFSTLNLTLDDFLVRLSVRLRLNFSVWLDFLIRLPSRFGTGGFGFFIHFSRSITTFCFVTWSLLLVIITVTFWSLFGHFYNFFELVVTYLLFDTRFEFWRPESSNSNKLESKDLVFSVLLCL